MATAPKPLAQQAGTAPSTNGARNGTGTSPSGRRPPRRLRLAVGAASAVLLGLVVLAALAASSAGTGGVGYIDTARLMERYGGALEARRQLEEETEAWQANVQTLQGELVALTEEIAAGADSLGADALEEKRAALARKRQELLRYSQAVEAKAAARERELMEPVLTELNARIQDFGKAEGYRMIFGTLAGGNVLYGAEGADLTGRFLDHLQSQR